MMLIPIAMADIISKGEEASTNEISGSLFCVIVVALIVLSKYLRNQRERIDLAASADELKTALQRLQRGVSKSEKVSVPSELLEQAARIETAQIAKERKDAVLQSVPVGPSGYGITFDRTAAEQRQMLNVSDRLELEDLVAELSIGGPGTLKSLTGAVANPQEAIRRAESKDRRVEIEYVVDQASHGIRIVLIRHQSPSSAKGGSHA